MVKNVSVFNHPTEADNAVLLLIIIEQLEQVVAFVREVNTHGKHSDTFHLPYLDLNLVIRYKSKKVWVQSPVTELYCCCGEP